jgi:hypothetical protein
MNRNGLRRPTSRFIVFRYISTATPAVSRIIQRAVGELVSSFEGGKVGVEEQSSDSTNENKRGVEETKRLGHQEKGGLNTSEESEHASKLEP